MIAVTGQSPLPGAPQNLSVLEAVLERITYANEDTGYTIARVATERTGPDLLTVVGPLLGAQVGESLRLTGRWSSRPHHKAQPPNLEQPRMICPARPSEDPGWRASAPRGSAISDPLTSRLRGLRRIGNCPGRTPWPTIGAGF